MHAHARRDKEVERLTRTLEAAKAAEVAVGVQKSDVEQAGQELQARVCARGANAWVFENGCSPAARAPFPPFTRTLPRSRTRMTRSHTHTRAQVELGNLRARTLQLENAIKAKDRELAGHAKQVRAASRVWFGHTRVKCTRPRAGACGAARVQCPRGQ